MNNNINPDKWYEKTWLVIILCVVFFPIGLYALWNNSSISKGWKVAITVIIIAIVIGNLGDKAKDNEPFVAAILPINTLETNDTVETSGLAKENMENSEKEFVINELKSKARIDWPNDFTTQEYWLNKQIEDYEYMLTIEDNSIKRQAQRDWPLDFSTQKYWYTEQIEARERMR
ncbi:MAG: hypothetical protein V4663_02760 [Bacteroidota bacterium]